MRHQGMALTNGHGRKKREPGVARSHTWIPLPRETHHYSNFLLLRISIEISNSARGEKVFSVAEGTLHSNLPLSPAGIARLRECHLIRLPRPVSAKRSAIDYAALQQTYSRMLADGGFVTHADLARHLGVSRVWVSRVLKGIKKDTG
jgi:hypothetical protein